MAPTLTLKAGWGSPQHRLDILKALQNQRLETNNGSVACLRCGLLCPGGEPVSQGPDKQDFSYWRTVWEASVCTCLARLCLCLVLGFLSEKLGHVGTKAFDKLGLTQKTSKFL